MENENYKKFNEKYWNDLKLLPEKKITEIGKKILKYNLKIDEENKLQRI